jgi:hypothetical protein
MAVVWWLWRARNLLCLANDLVSQVTLRMWTDNYAHLLFKCFFKATTLMILNVDGSSLGNPSISSLGGLFRNSDDIWIHGFAGNIGFSSILHAEFLAICYGLVMAWHFGFTELWCYSDSKAAIKLISKTINTWYHYAVILYNFMELLARDW